MQIIVNGENREFNDEITLQEVITTLQIEDKVMAAAVNMQIVKKEKWESFRLSNEDKLELLQFVGGGWVTLSKSIGDLAEEKACKFLQNKGFEILQKNFYAKKLGEIDIIASKNNIYHFCEVKSATSYETAILNITSKKLSKLKRSINYYLQVKNLEVPYCLDALIVVEEQIFHLENITF